MAKCVNCGADIPDNSKFCTKCGHKVENETVNQAGETDNSVNEAFTPVYEAPDTEKQEGSTSQAETFSYDANSQQIQTKKEKKPMNKKTLRMIIIIAAIAVVVIAAAIVAIVLVNKAKADKARTINVKDYIEVEFEGYDTYGTATASVDYYEFLADALEAQGYDEDTTSTRALSRTSDLYYGIDIELSKSEELAIGDEITVTVTCDEDAVEKANVIMKDVEFTVTVGEDDLEEVREVNPFDYVEVTFSGMDGDVTARFENTADEEPMDNLYFSTIYYLSVDEEFEVEISEWDTEYALNYYGIKYTETKKTYTVSGDDIDTYLESVEELSTEMVEELVEEAEGEVGYIWTYGYDLTDIKHYGTYVVNYSNSDDTSVYNSVYVVMTATATATGGYYDEFDTTTVFIPVEFRNVYVSKADDTLEYYWNVSYIAGDEVFGDTNYDVDGFLTESGMFKTLISDMSKNIDTYEVSGSLKDSPSVNDVIEEETTASEEDTTASEEETTASEEETTTAE